LPGNSSAVFLIPWHLAEILQTGFPFHAPRFPHRHPVSSFRRMRRIQSFLILGFFSAGCLGIALSCGVLNGLSAFWSTLTGGAGLPPLKPTILFSICFLLEFAAIWVFLCTERLRRGLLLCLLCAILVLGASLVGVLYGIALDPVPGLASLLIPLGLVALFHQTNWGSREPSLRRLFGQRLRPEGLRRLVDSTLSVDFPGELHEATVLVCTIHNHLELMETLRPADYVALMNHYLRAASDFLVDVGGYLDECSGESLRVVFGVPLRAEGPDNHASKAARVAVELLTRLEELNRECDARWQKRLDFHIGINSGPMIAAAFGGTRLGRYSVSGPVVEFAHHLSAACAQYGCRILSGPTTYEMASETIEGRPIDLLQRAGSRRRVELYEFLARKNALSAERERSRDLFWKGVILFRERKWEDSIKAFSSARIPGIPDRALDYYLERVERARRGEDEPTPEQALLAGAV
jgi:class 3 adenylate cyclase